MSQEKKDSVLVVSYTVNYNTERPVHYEAKLFFDKNNKNSIFIEYGSNVKHKFKISEEERAVDLQTNSLGDSFNLYNWELDSLFSKVQISNQFYLLKEKIPYMNWKLTNDIKTIDSKKLMKAVSYFRGREYIAWIDESLPIPIGPWKFINFPGLPLEIYDTTKRFVWRATKIEYILLEPNFIANRLKNNRQLKNIGIKQYADIRYNPSTYRNKILLSRLPSNTQVTVEKGPRNDKEILFEWEGMLNLESLNE